MLSRLSRRVKAGHSVSLRPPAHANARQIAEYYASAIEAARGRRGKATQQGRSAAAVFVREGDAIHVSYDVAAKAIRSGLRASIVNDIADALPVDKATVLRAIGIDKATLGRRVLKRGELDPGQAEAVLRTMEVTTLATETFGTLEKAAEWLKKPHPLLGGTSPLDYANNQYALAKIKSMLSAIRYGGVV